MPDYKPEQCWASHLPSLFSCLLATNGPVLEVGAGDWSTPLLRQYCKTAERKFVSIEEDPVWVVRRVHGSQRSPAREGRALVRRCG